MDISRSKVEAGKRIIADIAKTTGRVWYYELYTQLGLSHRNPGDRLIGSRILEQISRESFDQDGIMLTAVVIGKTEGSPAEGFYELAQKLDKLPLNADENDKLKFWITELNRIKEFFKEE